VMDFFDFFLIDTILPTGFLATTGGAAIAAVASPSVAAGASAKAAMRSGAHVVELSLGLLVAPSTDRLFDPGISLLVEDGAFACDTGAGLLAPADAVSIGLTNVRAATDNSVA
jgi:hypothetical protein